MIRAAIDAESKARTSLVFSYEILVLLSQYSVVTFLLLQQENRYAMDRGIAVTPRASLLCQGR